MSDLEAERIRRESEFKEIEQARATLMERSAALARAYTAKEAALARAEDAIAALNERIAALESGAGSRQADGRADHRGAQRRAAREKLERAVVEGALETGRKDFARLMREVMALQRVQQAAGGRRAPRAANAA